MDREKIIEFLEQNNLLEVLQRQIYYINFPRYRKVVGKSLYLDYLENGETRQFTCFNVIFDFAPIVVKNKKSQGF